MEWRQREDQADGEGADEGMDVEAPGYSVLRQNPWESFVRQLTGKPLVLLGGVVVVALVLLGIWRLVAGGGGQDLRQLAELRSELARIEPRVAAIEGRPAPNDTELKGLETKVDRLLQRLDRTEAAFSQRMGAVEQQLKERKAPSAAAPDSVEPKTAAAPAASPPTKSAPRIHTVKAGDTLFSISRSAGMSVDALRQLNHMKPDAPIHPGDRLKLSP